MRNEDEGIVIDVSKVFPEAARRVEILAKLRERWPVVVRNLSRWSWPDVLGVNELTIRVNAQGQQAKDKLYKMKGNVVRALSNLGYKTGEDFSLKIVEYDALPKKTVDKKTVRKRREPDEEKVKRYMEGAPDSLPEDINNALSHLMAYLDGL
ncbi:MAG: hypothetical protein IJP85_04875 [Synergistaceae bacterium]|nr:hypothetical protein [Synergistaceae bacterium]